jgi:TolB-like protein
VLLLALAIAASMGRILELLGPQPTVRVRSLAVLPLENLSGDKEQDYFADGMTEALTASLAQIRSVKVISRTSAMQYKGTKKPLKQIAGELGVDAVVEGSFARSGDRVRITAQLIQGATDQHSWARSFERELGDVLTLQDEIANAIAGQIEAELTQDEQSRLARKRVVAAKAYEAYLRGRFSFNEGGEKGLQGAFEQFNKALEIQSDYAAPYAGIANYYSLLPFYSSLSPADVTRRRGRPPRGPWSSTPPCPRPTPPSPTSAATSNGTGPPPTASSAGPWTSGRTSPTPTSPTAASSPPRDAWTKPSRRSAGPRSSTPSSWT